MTGTVRLAETCDGFGKNFDLAARCRQFCAVRIFAEAAHLPAIIRQLRYDQAIAGPELIKARRVQTALREALAHRLIEMLEPLADIAAFGELLALAETFGEIGKYLVIV